MQGCCVQELPLDQKLMLLSLQYPAMAREVVQSVLQGEGGCLEAATATLEFYDREVQHHFRVLFHRRTL